ncbi:hypothetical protein SO3561_10232 [Streptomyces olivochromogenes]|uniref:Uncharacterized protein n=1 Tax=Streptomyces olivochromogenes TaxID=1963 RepID=A0A286PGH8_STROL|nr:hypothetical protein SO3561_10232 [Streptomyces olivochromogenes]
MKYEFVNYVNIEVEFISVLSVELLIPADFLVFFVEAESVSRDSVMRKSVTNGLD